MPQPEPQSSESYPLLVGEEVVAYAAAVRRDAFTAAAVMLSGEGLPKSAALVEALGDLEAIELRTQPLPEQSTRARCRERALALRPLLDVLDPEGLTAVREAAADAEEVAWKRVVARRLRALAPGYVVAMFTAVETKLGVGHDDYSTNDVELYADGQDDPNEIVDLDDAELSRALGALAELKRPSEGAELIVDLDQDDDG
ncbi:hypothetical protein QR97_01830 [Streptomyces sp. PBH53]|nr:hypothetical protein QR97_01830 [Streptomyces sp. PBH53]